MGFHRVLGCFGPFYDLCVFTIILGEIVDLSDVRFYDIGLMNPTKSIHLVKDMMVLTQPILS